MHGLGQLDVRDVEGGATISVKVVPGSSRDRIAGVLGDCLKIATAAPAEKGRANRAVAAILAKALGVGARDVQLVSGTTSPRKEFIVTGVTAAHVRDKLAAL
jgi:uncharacterized protein (TIGR00251 family)